MAEGFAIDLPEAGPLEIRRTSERTRTHYVRRVGIGPDVLTVTGSRNVLDGLLTAFNARLRSDASDHPDPAAAFFTLENVLEARRQGRELPAGECRIYSGEHRLWWRPSGFGYTGSELEAAVEPFAEAFRRTSHCGPEKRIRFYPVAAVPAEPEPQTVRATSVPGRVPVNAQIVLLCRQCGQEAHDGDPCCWDCKDMGARGLCPTCGRGPIRLPWIVCRPRRGGGGWTPMYSTTARTRREAIRAYEANGSRYAADRRRAGVQVMRCTVAVAEGGR